VRALLASSAQSGEEHVFNIGSGRGHSLNEVLDAIERVTGRNASREYLSGRGFDVPVSVLDIERAKQSLGWAPFVSFDEGLERFAAWLLDNPE
jgi:UDP-glucose 4-epimerase